MPSAAQAENLPKAVVFLGGKRVSWLTNGLTQKKRLETSKRFLLWVEEGARTTPINLYLNKSRSLFL